MSRKPAAPQWAAAGATLFVLAAQAQRFPSPLVDAATGAFLPRFTLEFPWGHLLTTPWSALADMITFNSARQDKALAVYLLLGYWACRLPALARRPRPLRALRELGLYLGYLGVLLAFLCWALLAPRPAAHLRLNDPDLLALDFHSHTRFSHDGRRGFSPEANRAWHRAAGFSAGFITDHNTTAGALEGRAASDAESPSSGYRSLVGEEVSLQDTHVGVLGNAAPIDNRPYDGSPEGVRRFLAECRRLFGGVPILNLPEYRLRYWERLEEVAGWGAEGIELVNAVPKALDMSSADRDRVVDLARRRGLFLAGVSDNHGWGRASFVWSVMRLPGQARLGSRELERAVLEVLRREKFLAVQVVCRVKHQPSAGWTIALDPLLGVWVQARSFSPLQAAAVLLWIWGACWALGARRI